SVEKRPTGPSATRTRRALVIGIAAAASLAAAYAIASWRASPPRDRPEAEAEPSADANADRIVTGFGAIDWNDAKAWNEKMATLERLRKEMEALEDPRSTARVAPRYVDAVEKAFLDSGKASLERTLDASRGEWSVEERSA